MRSATRLRWWQLRPIEFGLLLYGIVLQRVLLVGLFVFSATVMDGGFRSQQHELAFRAQIGSLDGWVTLIFGLSAGWWFAALLSALVERCYGRIKTAFVFVVTALLLWWSYRVSLNLPLLE